MSGNSSRTTVFLAKRASTSDADGPKAFPYQVSASESYWSSQETFPTTFLTLLSDRPCTALMMSTEARTDFKMFNEKWTDLLTGVRELD